MNIIWFEQNMAKIYISVKEYGLEISKGAFIFINSENVLVGIDKDTKTLAVKGVEKDGYSIKSNTANKAIYRLNSKNLSKWLQTNGVEIGKYDCQWNEEEKILTAKYAWTMINGENIIEKALTK